MNYDDCVRLAAKEADETERGVIVQDTAWDGYEEIPSWIMQGYGTMAMEAGEQLKDYGCDRPTHVFVQAGVGSLAGAVVGYFTNLYPDNPPTFVVVEADVEMCIRDRMTTTFSPRSRFPSVALNCARNSSAFIACPFSRRSTPGVEAPRASTT